MQSLMLAAQPARSVLAEWKPWTLLQAMAGQPLQPRIQGLSLGLEVDRQDEGSPFSSCMPASSLAELVLLRHGIAVERVEGRDSADRPRPRGAQPHSGGDGGVGGGWDAAGSPGHQPL